MGPIMTTRKNLLRVLIALLVASFTFNIFAAEQAVKEDLTPPPPEGPITADQIPAIQSLPANSSAQPMPKAPENPPNIQIPPNPHSTTQ